MKFLARFVLLMVLPLAAWAVSPPAWINFQGRLLDDNGIPVTQTDMAFVVTIWSDPTSTAPTYLKYRESHTANVDDGVYSFPVGSGTPLQGSYGGSLYANNNLLFLEITVQGETLAPRHRLLSAAYTNHSGNSENLGGQSVSYFGTAAADASLQNQINNLSSQLSALESLCVAGGNIWESGENMCYQGTKVIDYQGKLVPVDQDNVQLALPDSQQECMQKHYRPVMGASEEPLEVLNCDIDPVEPPSNYGCGFGVVSSAITIKLQDCPFLLQQQQIEPK